MGTVFVKTTVRKRGDKAYTYLSLVESVRIDGKMTHNTLLRLGEVTSCATAGSSTGSSPRCAPTPRVSGSRRRARGGTAPGLRCDGGGARVLLLASASTSSSREREAGPSTSPTPSS